MHRTGCQNGQANIGRQHRQLRLPIPWPCGQIPINIFNAPAQDLDMSLVMMYGRVIKDHLPAHQEKYRIHKHWGEISQYRETAMTKRHMKNEKCYNAHTCPLWQLEVWWSIQIQNQVSPYLCQWAKNGRVVEAIGNRKINPVVDTPYHPTTYWCRSVCGTAT